MTFMPFAQRFDDIDQPLEEIIVTGGNRDVFRANAETCGFALFGGLRRNIDSDRAAILELQRGRLTGFGNGCRHDVHRRRADELGDEEVCRALVEFERRADLLDATGRQHDDPVGKRHRRSFGAPPVDPRRPDPEERTHQRRDRLRLLVRVRRVALVHHGHVAHPCCRERSAADDRLPLEPLNRTQPVLVERPRREVADRRVEPPGLLEEDALVGRDGHRSPSRCPSALRSAPGGWKPWVGWSSCCGSPRSTRPRAAGAQATVLARLS